MRHGEKVDVIRDGKVVAKVSMQTRSTGAAYVAGAERARFEKVNGRYAWVVSGTVK